MADMTTGRLLLQIEINAATALSIDEPEQDPGITPKVHSVHVPREAVPREALCYGRSTLVTAPMNSASGVEDT